MVDALLVVSGLLLLFVGGEALVRGATSMALALRFSTLMISAVVIGFGTSMPELLVSVRAAFAGTPGIALGNVIGSNTANILLIGGLAAILAPAILDRNAIRFDTLWMAFSAVVIVVALSTGMLARPIGIGLVVLLGLYLIGALMRGRTISQDMVAPDAGAGMGYAAIYVLCGLLALFAGADLLVRGATSIARAFGVSEAVIGLTIVAVGTSLPELATTVIAAIRRQGDVAFGNILGSNVFNVLAVLGVTSIIAPIPVAGVFNMNDAYVMLVVTFVLSGALLTGLRLSRPVGGLFIAAYCGYVIFLFA